jgi:hypothetical protein
MTLAGREQRKHDKRVRAEVLAACIKAIQGMKREDESELHDDNWDATYNRAVRDCGRIVQKLQPAAADLEELLRKNRLDEAKWWHNDGYPYHELSKCLCLACRRVNELEKACATEGKG